MNIIIEALGVALINGGGVCLLIWALDKNHKRSSKRKLNRDRRVDECIKSAFECGKAVTKISQTQETK